MSYGRLILRGVKLPNFENVYHGPVVFQRLSLLSRGCGPSERVKCKDCGIEVAKLVLRLYQVRRLPIDCCSARGYTLNTSLLSNIALGRL